MSFIDTFISAIGITCFLFILFWFLYKVIDIIFGNGKDNYIE